MAESLLERLLANGSTRLQSNASAFLSGDITLQQGTNVTLSQLGQVVTVDASLAALTRLRANASPFISSDVTLANGTNVTLSQVGNTITVNAAGGAALPSPYTATLVTYDGVADSLLITGPSGAYTTSDPPNVVVRGRDNTDVANSRDGGNAVLRGGDLAAGNTNGGEGGSAVVHGGTGNIAGGAFLQGGLTSTEGATAGNAAVLAGSGPDHTSLTNVYGGTVNVYAGTGKGSGDGGGVLVAAGYSYTGAGGLLQATAGSSGDAAAGGNAYWRAGDSAYGTGGAAEVTGGSGGTAGGTCSVRGGLGTAGGNGGACSVSGGAGNGAGNGASCSVAGGAGGSTGDGGDLLLAGGAGRAPGDVRISGGAHTSGTDEPGGSVFVRGGEGNANYGGAVSMSGGEGDAGDGGDLELFVGLDSAGTYSHGVLRFGVGGAEATPTVTKNFSHTHLIETETVNATPVTVFSETVPDHCVYTIVSVSLVRTLSGSYGACIGRRSTWRRDGASATQIGTTKGLTDADEDNGLTVTHTAATATVSVKAVGDSETTLYWRHTVQVLMHSVGS